MPAAGRNWETLRGVFERHIIPLLQEYFWGDYAKMALVLGSGFVELQSARKIRFAQVQSPCATDAQAALEEGETGRLAAISTLTETAFAGALDALLNNALGDED